MDKKEFFDRFCGLLQRTKDIYEQDSIHDALTLWFAENFLGLDPDEVKERIVEDKHGEGIDSILVDNNTSSLYFVQTKTVSSFDQIDSNFSENDLKCTLTGVRLIISGDYKGKITPELEGLANEYHEMDNTGIYKTKVLFIILKNGPVSDKFVKDFKADFPSVDVEFHDFSKLLDFYENVHLKKIADPPDRISFNALSKPLRKTDPVKSMIFSCKGSELANFYNDYGERVFQRNLRYSLGIRSKSINKQIFDTATSPNRAPHFWHFNNGITVVCEKIEENAAQTLLTLSKAQIINGAQTTSALLEASKSGKLDPNAEVLLRVIETNDMSFLENVTLYTNSQNAIRLRDLCSNDEIQIRIQRILESYGYFFERKRGEVDQKYPNVTAKENALGKKYKTRILTNENAAQAYLAFYLDKPSQSKAEKGRIFLKDTFGFYDAIFDKKDELAPEKILLSWKLLKYIELKKKEYKKIFKTASELKGKKKAEVYKLDFLLHSEYFFLNILRDFFVHEKSDIDKSKDVILSLIAVIDKNDDSLQKKYDTIKDTLVDFFEKQKAQEGYYHNKFFKNEKSIAFVRAFLKGKIDFIKV